MNIIVVPARMNSSRFPGKPLAKINGKPMIEHVVNGCLQAEDAETKVIVALCDQELVEFCELKGIRYVMTSSDHTRASDRCAEAVELLEAEIGERFRVVCMVQGDEPLVTKEMIRRSMEPVIRETAECTNLIGIFSDLEELRSPNSIKVVTDNNGNALYMSRAPIPYMDTLEGDGGKQVCVISFSREMLSKFQEFDSTSLELRESIDMLRLLENGVKVKMVEEKMHTHPVDVPEDIEVVSRLLREREDCK